MITKLTKPIQRRVADRVVRLTDKGLEIRVYRRRRVVLFTWDQLDEVAFPARTGREAFDRPCPRGWTPKPGDHVFACLREPEDGRPDAFFRRGEVVGSVDAFPQPIVSVRFRFAAGPSVRQFPRCDLRPAIRPADRDLPLFPQPEPVP